MTSVTAGQPGMRPQLSASRNLHISLLPNLVQRRPVCCQPLEAVTAQPAARCRGRRVKATAVHESQPGVETAQPSNFEAQYPAMLALIGRLHQAGLAAGNQGVLDKLLSQRPELTSVGFLLWVAQQEAAAGPGEYKQRLAALAEYLVVKREQLDQERLDKLYEDTLSVLTLPSGPQQREAVKRIAASAPSSAATRQLTGQQSSSSSSSRELTESGDQPHLASNSSSGRSSQVYQDGTNSADSKASVGNAGSLQGDVHASGQGMSSVHQAGGSDTSDSNRVARTEGSDSRSNDTEQSSTTLAQLQDPVQYAVRLAEAVAGAPVVLRGYSSPLYDEILAVAPPAVLSPEGLALAHRQAGELALDLKARRRRSVAAILGRTRVSPEQMDVMMAGTAAARILDLLLSFPTHDERVALLPDCFTPPSPSSESDQPAGTGGATGGSPHHAAQGDEYSADTQTQPGVGGRGGEENEEQHGGSSQEDEEYDQLWCTPAQLLSEVNRRIQGMQGVGGSSYSMDLSGEKYASGSGVMSGGSGSAFGGDNGQERGSQQSARDSRTLAVPEGQMAGDELLAALQQLRDSVQEAWLQGLETGVAAAEQ